MVICSTLMSGVVYYVHAYNLFENIYIPNIDYVDYYTDYDE